MNRKLAREAMRLLDAHQPFVRATIVRAVGSVPGKMGTSMIVRSDGSTLGTVGGAALEERIKELAREALEGAHGSLHHFDLQRWKEGGLPSLCGGSVDVALEYVEARPNLLLWGGGHVAEALAKLLPTLEYDYSVADDRPEWVTADRFPDADRREVVAPAELWTVFPPSEFTHLYVLGYDAIRDLEVLAASLEGFPGHIGMISSSAKREHLFAALRERKCPPERVDRIHAPIGLPIGAESPAEIAVAVVAEIVQNQHPRRASRQERAALPSIEEADVVSSTR